MITLVSLKTQKRKYAKSWLRWATCQFICAKSRQADFKRDRCYLAAFDSKERLGNPFYLETIEAINEEARHHQMTVAVASARDFDTLLKNVERMHLQKQVDGFILVYSDEKRSNH